MKTAIYIEDGIVQLVLTPQDSFEKKALRSFQEKLLSVKIFAGSFYDCRGGWIQQETHHPYDNCIESENRTKSLILRIEEPTTEKSG